MKFEVNNRYTREVQFTAEIDCEEDTPRSIKLGLAIRWGVENNADLSGSDLSGSYLRGSDLRGSDLSYSDLRGSDLSYSDLRDSDLRGSDLRYSDLSRADLSEANLFGANLSGARNVADQVIDGGIRSDGYRFFRTAEGRVIAGCRNFSVDEARKHWQETRGGTLLGDETMAILDHLENIARIRGWKTEQWVAA